MTQNPSLPLPLCRVVNVARPHVLCTVYRLIAEQLPLSYFLFANKRLINKAGPNPNAKVETEMNLWSSYDGMKY